MAQFITEDFLLQSKSASRLYHEYAKEMPIIDYHCHLPPSEIAGNRQYDNISQIWLGGDHYKWRAMRAAGIDERFITGDASDREKFDAWAKVCPLTVRNPLFHWTMLELNRPFGINDRFLNPVTADSIWNDCNAKLAEPSFSARGLMQQMNVRLVCTTDDPADSLEYHKDLANDYENGSFKVRVLPAFRPDKVMPMACTTHRGVENYLKYLERLGESADVSINSFDMLETVLIMRHDYFHQNGCRLSDHGFEIFNWTSTGTPAENEVSFGKILSGEPVSPEEALRLSSVLLNAVGVANAKKNWTMQLHIGAIRNNSSRVFQKLGPDAGCDSIADGPFAQKLSRFLDHLDLKDRLPKTIVYNLNPADNYMLASMVMNFNHDIAGKMQFGSGWWFLDQKNGMEEQINTLSNMGLLSKFVGMLTDSRSFLSYTRHEYFRRILCNILGNEMETGIIPNDFDWIGAMVKDISYNNANEFFGFNCQ